MKEDGFIGRIEKRGNGYRFKIYDGYKADGTQNIVTKTWVPEAGMTPKQIEKECQKQFVIFEEEVKTGSFVSANVIFVHLLMYPLRFKCLLFAYIGAYTTD